jgi:GNAT superfamily N-acetyltransferase
LEVDSPLKMNRPSIGPLTADHLIGAYNLSATAGWNQRIEDWHTLVRLAPAGSFAAFDDDRIVGTAIGIDYRGFGWVAMMLVDPNYRGRGLGARLLEAALNALPSDRAVRLDATPMGRALYERYGFVEEATLTRFVAAASDRSAGAAAHAHPLTPADLGGVASDDREIFGGDRGTVLAWSLTDAPAYARVMRTAGRGYCFGRHGRLFDQVGPVVAQADEEASTLVAQGIAAAADCALVVDAFDANVRFTDWLRSAGFRGERPLFRMRREARGGRMAATERDAKGLREFAIFGPEFG